MKTKIFAPETTSLEDIFQGIKDGKYYTNACDAYRAHGFEEMTVDINASEFDIDNRHSLQIAHIPENKRGNLGKYASKNVDVICSHISRNGPRINFYIRTHK